MSKLEQRTYLPRASRIGDTVRDCLTHAVSKIPTSQYIIYNIKRVVWRLVSSCANDSTVRDLEFPDQSPSTNQLCGPHRGFAPGRTSDHVLAPSRPRFSKPSCHHAGTTTKRSPHQTQPDACPRNGPGPPANPPQSGDQPTHLPHLPRTGVKKPTRRQDSQRP